MKKQIDYAGVVLSLDPEQEERRQVRTQLQWDYSQVPALHRRTVEDAAVEILVNGRKMQQSVLVIGQRLSEVKRLLDHGQFGDWCEREFAMNVRTAQRMMSVAANLDGKCDKLSHLGTSVLYLIGADSTPEPVREAVIEQAQITGRSPSVAEVKTAIQAHKPPKPAAPRRYESGLPALNMPAPTAPAPAIVAADARPLPQWVTAEPEPEPEPLTAADLHVMQPPPAATHEAVTRSQAAVAAYSASAQTADDRVGKMVRLIGIYKFAISTFDEYGDLIGAHLETLAAKRELEKLIRHLERECALLEGRPVADAWMVEEAA